MTESTPIFPTPEAAETAFYAAFAMCDVQAMKVVWSDGEVVCIHPGSSALVGHDAVMRSWTHILTDAEQPHLHIEPISRIADGKLAVHVVEEHITSDVGIPGSTAVVLATNIYRHEDNGWRMWLHHASMSRSSQHSHTLQ